MFYHKMQGYHELVGNEGSSDNSKTIQARLVAYISYKHEQGARSQSIGNHLTALRHFYWINEVDGIKWDRVRSYLGEPVKAVEDKAYTHEQIAQVCSFTDYRMKIAVMLQATSAMRIGAIADKAGGKRYLRVGDLTRIEKHGIYSIKAYSRTSAQYITFCTPECAKVIDDYLAYRRQQGETITADSPLIREQFSDLNATRPRPASLKTIEGLVRRAFVKAGLRTVEKGGSSAKRKENMLTHGLRKFAKKNMRKAGIDPVIIEYLMGHRSGDLSMGVTKLMMTYDPSEDSELLTEYLKAVDNLTISNEARERFKAQKLEQENKALQEQIDHKIVDTVNEKLRDIRGQFVGKNDHNS